MNIEALCKRVDAERTKRRTQWYNLWEEVAHFFHNRRLGFLGEYVDGEERYDFNYTSAPLLARRDFSDMVGQWTRPPNRVWSKPTAEREELNYDPDARMWLQAVGRITYKHLYDPVTHFEERAREFDDDLITFGTSVMYVGEAWHRSAKGEMRKRLYFKTPHLRNIVILQNAWGDIDGVGMYSSQTLRQLKQMFPDTENWPNELQDCLRDRKIDWDKPREILCVVLPNDEFQYYGFGPKRLPFAALWIDVATKTELDRGGHNEFPFVVGRWDTASEEIYGRSPAMLALNDARTANGISGSLLELIEKASNPPQTAPADMIRGDVEMFPGGLTLYDAGGFAFQGSPIKPVELGKEPQGLAQFLERLEQRIAQAFYANALQLPDASREFTSEEIRARMGQAAQKAAPIFARIQSEFNGPLLDRVYDILLRNGAYPPAPEVLQGENIVWGYDSPVQDALEAAEADKTLMALGTLVEMGPEAVQHVNIDVAARTVARQKGLPEAMLKPDDQVAQERAEAQEMMRMQQMAEMAKNAAPALKAAGDASGTPLLQDLTNQNALPPPGQG